MMLIVTGSDDNKGFRWEHPTNRAETTVPTLGVFDFSSSGQVAVHRNKLEIDRCMVLEPRGEQACFSGLRELLPRAEIYFFEIPANAFLVGDVVYVDFGKHFYPEYQSKSITDLMQVYWIEQLNRTQRL